MLRSQFTNLRKQTQLQSDIIRWWEFFKWNSHFKDKKSRIQKVLTPQYLYSPHHWHKNPYIPTNHCKISDINIWKRWCEIVLRVLLITPNWIQVIDQDTTSRRIVIEEKNSKPMQICSIMIHSAVAVPVAFNINNKVTARYIRSYFQVHGLLRLPEIPTDFSASKILQKKQKFKIRVLMFQITQWHEKLTRSSPLNSGYPQTL